MKTIIASKAGILEKLAAPLALLLPWLITPVAFLVTSFMPKANLSLLYLLVVIFIAIKFTLKLTLISAVSGFLAFNYFFTEPYGSFIISSREDLFSVLFFLVTALIVGHLATRLKQNTREIALREKMTGIELEMLENLSKAIDAAQALKALEQALNPWKDCYSLISHTDNLETCIFPGNYPAEKREKLATLFSLKPQRHSPHQLLALEQEMAGYLLHNGRKIIGLMIVADNSQKSLNTEFLTLLLRQVNNALERIRLVGDLAQERVAKENELLRSALLSSVSHDFRTPLTTMIGATSTVLEMGDQLAKPQVEELLTTVLEEAQRLNRYTQNLLDMTRLGFGELRLERHWISAAEIISVVKKRMIPLLERHQLHLNLAPHLPLLHVHAALLEQAIFNVLDNAVKFAPVDSIITLTAMSETNKIVITLCDTGPGIPDEEKEKVFERFHTAERGDRRKSGSGLGLTICRGMIAAHGGKVSIHDNPGIDDTTRRGCCVRMELPVEKSPEML